MERGFIPKFNEKFLFNFSKESKPSRIMSSSLKTEATNDLISEPRRRVGGGK